MNRRSAIFRRWMLLAGAAALVGGAAVVIWIIGARPDTGTSPVAVPQPLAPLRPAPPGDAAAAELRPELREILGLTPGTRPSRRLELLRACGSDLDDAECEALLAALAAPRDSATDPGWHAEYFHETALVLRRHPQVHERFARVLATVAADETREAGGPRLLAPTSSRGLGGCRRPSRTAWPRSSRRFGRWRHKTPHSVRRRCSRFICWGLILPPVGHGKGEAIPTRELEPLVIRALESPPGPAAVGMRLSSLRVAGERGIRRALPAIRGIATDATGEHALARMAAIAALATFDEPADRPVLDALAASSDPRIAGAARHALARLD